MPPRRVRRPGGGIHPGGGEASGRRWGILGGERPWGRSALRLPEGAPRGRGIRKGSVTRCAEGWYPGSMRNEFSAVVERDDGWYIAYALEVPGANGQGRTREEALESLRDAVALILDDRREDALRGVPADADRATVVVE